MFTNELNPVEVLHPAGGTMKVFKKHGFTYGIVGDSRTIEIYNLAELIKECKEAKKMWAKLNINYSHSGKA